ncbi:MAG: RsmD family RNA methyltransferase [Bacteroidota bacterium]
MSFIIPLISKVLIESILKPKVQKFINDNLNVDIPELLLSKNPFSEIPFPYLADQIISKRKAKTKLPSWFANPDIVFPPPLNLEQSSSEPTAAYKFSNWQPLSLIDLTGGSAIDFSFLSRKSKRSYFIEPDEDLLELSKHNIQALGLKNVKFVNGKAEGFVDHFSDLPIDLIYIDPSRRKEQKKVFSFEDCSPNIRELIPGIFRICDHLLIKTSPLLDIKKSIKELGFVKEVHIVSVRNECKEVLYFLENSFMGEASLRCVNLESSQNHYEFTFKHEESIDTVPYTSLENELFLYEPNSSILKGGAFKSIASKFDLSKISLNSHLYTSKALHTDFPGRVFKIKGYSQASKKDVGKLLSTDKVNVSTRNFPLTSEQLKAKLKLRDGGDQYLFATTLSGNKRIIIVCEKL